MQSGVVRTNDVPYSMIRTNLQPSGNIKRKLHLVVLLWVCSTTAARHCGAWGFEHSLDSRDTIHIAMPGLEKTPASLCGTAHRRHDVAPNGTQMDTIVLLGYVESITETEWLSSYGQTSTKGADLKAKFRFWEILSILGRGHFR